MSLRELIAERIRERGPLSFARYMDLALYHSRLGYYTRTDRRSGRVGDFFTSVDLGPVFGELLAIQFVEMWRLLVHDDDGVGGPLDLVEAAAGNGRLSRDVLEAAAATAPELYPSLRLTLVERSPAARAAQRATLGRHADRLAASGTELPDAVRGVIFANELLDSLPVHALAMTDEGLREVYVDADGRRLVERLGPLTPEARAHVERENIRLESGWRVEVCPAARAWVADAAARLRQGFLVVIDYGHEARELYSATHAAGTLATYHGHQIQQRGEGAAGTPPWLAEPGAFDITAHVDLTAVRRAAERAGLQPLAVLDQTYFLLGLGAVERLLADSGEDRREAEPGDGLDALKRRLALKTLLVPGGLGSTHKVLIFGKGVGTPELRGCSFRVRAT